MFGKLETLIKSKLVRTVAAIGIAAGIGLASPDVRPYATGYKDYPSIHPLLAEKLPELLNLPKGKTFDLEAVKEGSINEDSPGQVYIRTYFHFISDQDPEYGVFGFPSSKVWGMSSKLQSGKVDLSQMPLPLQLFYEAAVDTGAYPFGDHSWNQVVIEYQQGKIGSSYGYIFHLISDATVPAHTRIDPHFGDNSFVENLTEGSYFQIAIWPSDAYEVWTDKHKAEIMDLIQPKKENVPDIYDGLGGLLDDLANFTTSNFYSDDTVDGTIEGLTLVKEGNRKYYVKQIKGKNVHVLRKGLIDDFPDTTCFRDYFEVLGTTAVEYGAAAANLLIDGTVCYPNCWMKECGSDNCGGSCGKCSSGKKCLKGECKSQETVCNLFDHLGCNENEIWWFDSCDELQQFYQECGTKENCIEGQCFTACKDECSYEGQTKCDSATAWTECKTNYQGCLKWTGSYDCSPDSCENGKCAGEECTPNAYSDCHDGNVWSFNSCGDLETIIEYCDSGCSNGTCSGQECSCSGSQYCVNGECAYKFCDEWFDCEDQEVCAPRCMDLDTHLLLGEEKGCCTGMCLTNPNDPNYNYHCDTNSGAVCQYVCVPW